MAYGASSFLAGTLFLPRVWFLLTQRISNAEEGLRLMDAVRQHGKWSILLTATKKTGDALPNIVLASVAGTEFVAIYHVAASYINVLQTPINSIGQVLGPVIANEFDSAQLIVERVTKYGIILAVPLSLFGAILAQWLIPSLFSGSYENSVKVAVILAPMIISGALRSSQRALLYALRRQDLALSSYALVFVFDVSLSAVMAWQWSVVGFAVARTAATFFIFIVREYQLRRLGRGLPTAKVLHLDEFDRSILRRLVTRFI
jgi:O-antigen/teichoic acid export membrane protein